MNELDAIARRAMVQRGLLPEFSAAALAEVAALGATPAEQAGSQVGVRDLRGLLWASIDNDSSRDLDQLSVAEPLGDGTTKILVAIADVDATVRPRSAIDEHARVNTTSVYTAARVFPMLPERLSTDLTSLGQDRERLALVVEMVVTGGGTVTRSEVYRATVVNRSKLAYDSVAAWLDGSAPPPAPLAAVPGMDEQLRMQDRVAHAMRALRFQQGALNLETTDAQPVFDGGVLSDLIPDQPNRAKELIEELMIAANGVTARFLAQHGFASLRRVLRSPERWDRLVALAAGVGERLPQQPDGRALSAFLAKRRDEDPARFPDLSLAVVKLLGRGEYVFERATAALEARAGGGHFGLAVSDYTHATAPNRRFADLTTHRLLKAALAGQPSPYADDELVAIARQCTDQETNAAKVERQVQKSAAALLLGTRVGQRFEGVVTGASEKGTWVRVSHPSAEGRIVRGFEGLDVGDRVAVQLVATNAERGFIDFARVAAPSAGPTRSPAVPDDRAP